MATATAMAIAPEPVKTLPHAPPELTCARLRRLGEGLGKVVYASQNWVVKRERSPSEVVALILLWKGLRRFERALPGGARLARHPSRQIHALRLGVQAVMTVVPKAVWFSTHVRSMWRVYHTRSVRGERLADEKLGGSDLLPERISFPPTQVRVGGWPGTLTVEEAVERVECTLYDRIAELARAGRQDDVRQWLDRFLDLRLRGWRRGVFSVDTHLKNFGVIGDRIVLLDSGGLTDRWREIDSRLAFEESVGRPHAALGLDAFLEDWPELAAWFDARWKETVNPDTVRACWPSPLPGDD